MREQWISFTQIHDWKNSLTQSLIPWTREERIVFTWFMTKRIHWLKYWFPKQERSEFQSQDSWMKGFTDSNTDSLKERGANPIHELQDWKDSQTESLTNWMTEEQNLTMTERVRDSNTDSPNKKGANHRHMIHDWKDSLSKELSTDLMKMRQKSQSGD